MCGVTGFYLNCKDYSKKDLLDNLNLMTDQLVRRGPDNKGIWLENNRIGLGHRRLSIRDLSNNGSQPMHSSCGRYTIVYNGEIYDNVEIKKIVKKKNIKLKSTTDTEILLESISILGLNKTLENINGMFAFALYDKYLKKIYLVRDRLGIKPLFYYKNKNSIAFASEIKAIKKFFKFEKKINTSSLNSFLKYGFNKTSTSIFENLEQVKPGEIVEIDHNLILNKKKYWNLLEFFKEEKNNNTLDKNIGLLEKLINNAVKIRLESDVEVGSFLSGGIDSTIISKTMSEVSKKKINTFSVGFLEKEFDESADAKKIANHIGSNHHEIIFGKKELLNFFEELPNIYDEPFADSSQIPTSIISQFAKKNQTGVILSGDGGDELFGGYNRYIEANNAINQKINFKIFVKQLIGSTLTNLNPKIISILENIFNQKNLQERSKKYLAFQLLNNKSYSNFLSQIFNTDHIISTNILNREILNNDFEFISNSYEKFMAQDLNEYLPNDILTKVDRASMYSSLEVRVPLLDYRIVKFAINLKIDHKINNSNQKILLRKLLEKKIPKYLIKKKKVGFGIPIDKWLNTFLREKVNFLLSDECLNKNPYLNKETVKLIWSQHKNGMAANSLKIWNIIVLQNWINSIE